jgi:3-oxoacyl-[acyl-carrier-protein] synthase II
LNVEETWKGIISGQSGVGPITLFDASDFKTTFAAEVKGFDPDEVLTKRLAHRTDRFTQFSLEATRQALADASLAVDDNNRDRIGVVIGTGIGGMTTLTSEQDNFNDRGPRWVSPHMVPMMLPDTAPGYTAIEYGMRGPNMAVVTACASSANAIGEATEMIRRGAADVMIAGGAEAAIIPVALAGFNNMGALSTRNDDPQAASRPFDIDRDGFIMGEGAASLVLEKYEHAVKRGADILAEVLGYSATNDAYHISAPAKGGAGAAICMQNALNDAGLEPGQIDYINAHGTSTSLNDASETAAVKTIFGEQAYNTPVSSTKSMTGHLLGAAGALESLFCIKAMQENVLPPTINYTNPDPECDLDYVPNTKRAAEVSYAMTNSFGFGGHNACLIYGSV